MGIFHSILFISLEMNKIRSQELVHTANRLYSVFSPILSYILPARTSYPEGSPIPTHACKDKNMSVVAHSAILIVGRDKR